MFLTKHILTTDFVIFYWNYCIQTTFLILTKEINAKMKQH